MDERIILSNGYIIEGLTIKSPSGEELTEDEYRKRLKELNQTEVIDNGEKE